MKRLTGLKSIFILTAIIFTHSGFAFEVGGARKECRPPKFRSFSPPEKTRTGPVPEVDPEAVISFTVSNHADPESIKVIVRKQLLNAVVLNKNSFFHVSAKLPVEFNGKYARIDIRAEDKERGCDNRDGWLIKVRDEVKEVASNEPELVSEEKKDSEK